MKKRTASNAISADMITREECQKYFNVVNMGIERIIAKENGKLEEMLKDQNERLTKYNENKSQWMKKYFSENFPQFLNCHYGKVLMGIVKEDDFAYRARTKEF